MNKDCENGYYCLELNENYTNEIMDWGDLEGYLKIISNQGG